LARGKGAVGACIDGEGVSIGIHNLGGEVEGRGLEVKMTVLIHRGRPTQIVYNKSAKGSEIWQYILADGLLITAQITVYHCIFQFITAHFVCHCTL